MRGFAGLSGWTAIAGASGAVVTALIVASTFLPGAPLVPLALVFVLFVGVFPVFAAALAGARRQRGQDPSAGSLSPVVRKVGFCGLVAAFAIAGLSIDQLPGQPTLENGRYYYDDHGQLIPTTASGYRHGQALEERIFGGGAYVFYAVAVAASAGLLPQRGPRQRLKL